jgi:hypothetical protein
MKIVTLYEAHDGLQFSTERECLEHEQACANVERANEMLQNGSNLFDVLTVASGEFSVTKNLSEDEKLILQNMTSNTGIIIEHWQCSKEPGYKVCYIKKPRNGFLAPLQLYVHGDPGWPHGAWGHTASVKDLIGYARATFEKFNKSTSVFE